MVATLTATLWPSRFRSDFLNRSGSDEAEESESVGEYQSARA